MKAGEFILFVVMVAAFLFAMSMIFLSIYTDNIQEDKCDELCGVVQYKIIGGECYCAAKDQMISDGWEFKPGLRK